MRFELMIQLPVCRFSKPVPSTAQPRFHMCIIHEIHKKKNVPFGTFFFKNIISIILGHDRHGNLRRDCHHNYHRYHPGNHRRRLNDEARLLL